jgi:hypothetical protein
MEFPSISLKSTFDNYLSFDEFLYAEESNSLKPLLPESNLKVEAVSEEESKKSKSTSSSSQKEDRKTCDTKNFLVNFKKIHFQVLEKALGYNFYEKYPDIKEIKETKGMTMKDFELIYNE